MVGKLDCSLWHSRIAILNALFDLHTLYGIRKKLWSSRPNGTKEGLLSVVVVG